MELSRHKQKNQAHFDALSGKRRYWKQKNRHYYAAQKRYFRFLVPDGKKVLELGCGTGELLAALNPAVGTGIDISTAMVTLAKEKFPHLDFRHADAENPTTWNINDTFDYIIIADTIGLFEDVQAALEGLRPYCHPDTRLIISYYNFLWAPVLKTGEHLGLKMPEPLQNWLSPEDIKNLLFLSGFETVKCDGKMLFPKKLPVITKLFDVIGSIPVINNLCLCNYLVARPFNSETRESQRTVSVIIPCRNEKGNIEPAIRRMPAIGSHMEIIFIDGHSLDGTQDEIRRVIRAYPEKDIHFLVQDNIGKYDAVKKGFAHARGDILMILDADLTVLPEDLPKLYCMIASGKGEFINGCRLVYPMEKEAMRFFNMLGNKFFSLVFSWLLNQRIKDTLCGTKVISRTNYERIVENRGYFGDFDPFGDFDLLFGASKLNLKIIEVPIRYQARTYGETQISRFRHGWLLLRMALFAIFKLKLI